MWLLLDRPIEMTGGRNTGMDGKAPPQRGIECGAMPQIRKWSISDLSRRTA